MDGETVLAIVGGLGGLTGLAALGDVYLRRNKTKAEEKKLSIDGDVSITVTVMDMYKLARQEAQEAKMQASYCEAKVDALEEHLRVLRGVMRRHDLDPPPFQFPNFLAWQEQRA